MCNVQQRLMAMWNGNGDLITHIAPDADSLLSVWIIYHFINNVLDISLPDFVKRVRLEPANIEFEYPHFGVDIGKGMGPNHIKEGNFPVAINGKVYKFLLEEIK